MIDYDELLSGERKEGAYSAAQGFATKSANAAIILATSLVLQLADFVPNVEQTGSTEWILRAYFSCAPFVLFLIGAAALRRFRFGQREHARVRAELDRRAERV